MLPADVEPLLRRIVEHLVAGDYAGLARADAGTRVDAEALERAVTEYGRRLVTPPPDAWRRLEPIRIRASAVPSWALCVPLWTAEEGRSDLELELTVRRELGGRLVFELEDLHVL